MDDAALLLEDSVKRANSLEKIISEGIESIDLQTLALILPPSIKYSHVKSYDLQKKSALFYFSLVFQYTPTVRLPAAKTPGTKIKEGVIMLPFEMVDSCSASESEPGLVGLEMLIECSLDPESIGCRSSELTSDGLISSVKENRYIDEKTQRVIFLMTTDNSAKNGRMAVFEKGQESIDMGDNSKLHMMGSTVAKTYVLKDGLVTGNGTPYEGRLDFVHAMDYVLKASSKDFHIKHVNAYVCGKPVDITALLKDIRRWYSGKLK